MLWRIGLPYIYKLMTGESQEITFGELPLVGSSLRSE